MTEFRNSEVFWGIMLISIIIIVILVIFNHIRLYNVSKYGCGCELTENFPTPKNKLTVKLYYATWCGFCIAFFPDWKKAKEDIAKGDYKNYVTFEEYDCDKSRDECQKAGIRGFPSIIAYKDDGTKIDFPGNLPRNYDTLMNFIKTNLK